MNINRLRILLIGPFPKPITGNSLANKVAFEGLKSRGYELDKINTSLPFFDEKVGVFSIRKFFHGITYNLKISKILNHDVIYVTPGQSFFGVLKYGLLLSLSKVLNKKTVIHIHGNFLGKAYNNANYIQKKCMKIVLCNSSAGIVLSKSLIPNLTPFLPNEKIHVVHNFVENYLLENTEERLEAKNISFPRIIFLSNLMEEKGILDLLEALLILEREGVNYEAKIAGNIDLKSKEIIVEYFNKLKNVDYCGIVSGEAKKEMLLWGNIFVFPSYYKMEGQPISLLEAMATGNIIVTTKHAGIPDILTDKNGLFVKKQDARSLVETIKLIIAKKNTFQNMIHENHIYAKSNFTSETYINQLERVFKLA